MDILVLDAPMKFIHGKMVEQGAQEWSRYLTSQFNPLGRGTLYSESFDQENGLKVYLYSAAITLECVGENKGYLKVVKAEETDVLTYHKVIEEGKLLEEKITFVPVYKFQYINGKEHHDVERFMQFEKEKQDLEDYVSTWTTFITNEQNAEEVNTSLKSKKLQQTLEALYKGKIANRELKALLPKLEILKPFQMKEIDYERYTMQYDNLSNAQKLALEKMLSTEDLYFVQTQQMDLVLPLIREVVHQVTKEDKKVLVSAMEPEQVDVILEDLENHLSIETAHLQGTESKEYLSQYALKHKAKVLQETALEKLNEEATKHNRHKEELDQMKAECELYQNADKTIKFCFEILSVLEEIEEEKIRIQTESQELGAKGMEYASALEKYEAIPENQLQIYCKIKEKVDSDGDLYNEIVWVKHTRKLVHYQDYKQLMMTYAREVQAFEEKVVRYKNQIEQKTQYEEEYKGLEAKLLELRRQYLKTEALKQVDPNGEIETDEAIAKEISELESQLVELRNKKKAHETGLISTRYLDELKSQVYELKEQVEAYISAHENELNAIYQKEHVTKAEVLEIFKCMERVEALFEGQNYEDYIDGVEEYFGLEEIVYQNKQLIELQEANQSNMSELLKKQMEVMSLLSTKLEEKEFRAFIKLIDEGDKMTKQILRAPLDKESTQNLEILKEAVEQRAFKIQIYKEKVEFYEGLSKLKEQWKNQLLQDEHVLLGYISNHINVVGATCKAIELESTSCLTNEAFEYVIIHQAHQMIGLELFIPMIKGKKVIIIGDLKENPSSLFAKLFEICPKENKSVLEVLV